MKGMKNMREYDFKMFLDASGITPKSVKSIVRDAKKAENALGICLDAKVSNDDTMYEALQELRLSDDLKHGHMQRALRKYYEFCNGKEFPQLRYYHSAKHP